MDDQPKNLFLVGHVSEENPMLKALLHAGYRVTKLHSGSLALNHVAQHGLPHLFIVHLDLPDMSGTTLCRKLMAFADPPIIVIAPQNHREKATSALQYADDFVRMPVDADELVMRARRILSRISNFSYASGPLIEICDGLTVNYQKRSIIVNGEIKHLTPTENTLLHVLIKHWGKVVNAETLIERTWRTGISISDRNALRVHMHRLRNKLEDNPQSPNFIQTEHGIGYTFNGC